MTKEIYMGKILGRDRYIGDGHDPYIIAEVGGNHDGNLHKALLHLEEAAKAGVDCVKYQIYKSERLLGEGEKAFPAVRGFKNQLERQKVVELGWDEFEVLAKRCKELGIHFSASVFHEDAVDLLVDELGTPFIKVASGEITNIPLLKHVAKKANEKNIPIFLSTAGCEKEKMDIAVSHLPKDKLVLLHCTLPYPTKHEDANLGRITALRNEYDVLAGYSDHTVGIDACVGASYLGAAVLEKHFATNNRYLCTGDHKVSAEPNDLKNLVGLAKRAILHIGKARGESSDAHLTQEAKDFAHQKMRRALFVTKEIKAGETFTEENLTSMRPENKGISVIKWEEIIGKKAKKDLSPKSFVTEDDVN